MQLMLMPGEVRTAPAADEGFQVTVNSVAGGSFTQVRVSDAQGLTVLSKTFQYDTDALKMFEDLTGPRAFEDEM